MDYKKYSLEQLENWVHDAIDGDATPQEIYDCIFKVVKESYYYHKHHTSRASELLALLNSNGKGHIKDWDAWEQQYYPEEVSDGYEYTPLPKKGEVEKWVLPVQLDGLTGELYVSLPDDLLEKVGWKEGDMVEYVPDENGFYVMRKVSV